MFYKIIFVLLYSLPIFISSLQAEDIQYDETNETTEVGSDYSLEQEVFGEIKSVRIENTSSSTRSIIFTLDTPTVANIITQEFPSRIVVDIPMPYKWNVVQDQIDELPIYIVSSFRYENPTDDIFRVILDIDQSYSLQSAYIKDVLGNQVVANQGASNGGNRLSKDYELHLVFSSNNLNSDTSSYNYNSLVVSKEQGFIQKVSDKVSYIDDTKESPLYREIEEYLNNVSYKKPFISDFQRPIRVFIDPGHGGRDPGAISLDNTLQEKELVLRVAKELKSVLEKNEEIEVILSRDDDYYIPLNDRTLWAQYLRADIFVSIHADKVVNNTETSGMSIYTLSDSASDSQTAMLAESENDSDIVAGIAIDEDDKQVNSILLNLSQRVKSNDSIDLAHSIINQSSKLTTIIPNPIRSAAFVVLKVPSVPSVLVELGFLSNEKDVIEFKKQFYTEKISVSLSAGIEYYLWDKGLLNSFPVNIITNMNSYLDNNIETAIQNIVN